MAFKLKWAAGVKNIAWSQQTDLLLHAARGGALSCMEWRRERSVEVEVVRWLHVQGVATHCPSPNSVIRPRLQARDPASDAPELLTLETSAVDGFSYGAPERSAGMLSGHAANNWSATLWCRPRPRTLAGPSPCACRCGHAPSGVDPRAWNCWAKAGVSHREHES
jgi:hypothetical protein